MNSDRLFVMFFKAKKNLTSLDISDSFSESNVTIGVCGSSSVVEHHLAKVRVASSSLVSRFLWRHSQVAKAQDCKSLIPGSNPGAAFVTSNLTEPAFIAGFCRLCRSCDTNLQFTGVTFYPQPISFPSVRTGYFGSLRPTDRFLHPKNFLTNM